MKKYKLLFAFQDTRFSQVLWGFLARAGGIPFCVCSMGLMVIQGRLAQDLSPTEGQEHDGISSLCIEPFVFPHV